MRSLLPTYLILLLGLGGSAFAQGHPMEVCHSGEAWSTRYPSLNPGDFVHIPVGVTVVLDTQTQLLGGLWVEGDLIFDHSKPGSTVELRTAYAVVTGTLQIGCKQGSTITRFTKKTHLTLIAPESYPGYSLAPFTAGVQWPAAMDTRFSTGPVYEAALDRGLIIAGTGELYVYGNDSRAQTWTTLANTVAASDSLLPLTDPVWNTWKVTDEIVIASTDFEYADQWIKGVGDGRLLTSAERGGHAPGYVQGEKRQISVLNPGTQSVTVSAQLEHGHWAASVSANFGANVETMDMRAEVGNLTRSVVIRGEESAYSSSQRGGTTHRGHVILLKEVNDVPYCEVDWAEFQNLGIQRKFGRYPFHWHMLGDARKGADRPYLRDSSIHGCVNRFVTVHNTMYVDIERNVGWDTLGAGFFLEDASEAGQPIGDQTQCVILRDNLGMKIGRPGLPSEYPFDYPAVYKELEVIDPPVFWIQHPNQIIEGNHAAGAAGHGFYLVPSWENNNTWSHQGTSSFKNNVAHSNGQHGFYHQARIKWNWQIGDDPAGEGLVAWKNRRYGIWWRTHGVSLLSGCKLADNKSGFYPASGGQQDAAADPNTPPTCRLTFTNGLIFGETPNVGEPEALNPAENGLGRSLPQTYWNFVRPEPVSAANESAWDTLNAFESYDGRNVVTDLKLAYFPASRNLPNPDSSVGGTADQATGGATQTEYNSRYLEDPRNDVSGFEYATGVGQGVANPIIYRLTDPNSGFSMIRHTVIYDHDDSLGHGAGVYVCYDDLFFEANATGPGTQVVTPPLRILPTAIADFAQFEVRTNHTSLNQKMTVTVSHHAGGTRQMKLATLPNPDGEAQYGFNAPIGLDTNPATDREGIYTCSFPTAMPTEYTIKIQFAEAEGLPTIIGVPLAAAPIGLVVNNIDLIQLLQEESTLQNLLNSGYLHAFYYDSGNDLLYIRTTTRVLGPNAGLPLGPDLDGTRNIIEVN